MFVSVCVPVCVCLGIEGDRESSLHRSIFNTVHHNPFTLCSPGQVCLRVLLRAVVVLGLTHGECDDSTPGSDSDLGQEQNQITNDGDGGQAQRVLYVCVYQSWKVREEDISKCEGRSRISNLYTQSRCK